MCGPAAGCSFRIKIKRCINIKKVQIKIDIRFNRCGEKIIKMGIFLAQQHKNLRSNPSQCTLIPTTSQHNRYQMNLEIHAKQVFLQTIRQLMHLFGKESHRDLFLATKKD